MQFRLPFWQRLLLTIVAMLAVSWTAGSLWRSISAQELPRGSYLLERCSANNGAGDQECFTRIFLVMRMAEEATPPLLDCAPHEFDLYKLQKTVLEVLRVEPKRLQEAYTRSVLIAANRLYPCPNTKPN